MPPPTSPLLLEDVFTRTAFNDDFKRQQNSAVQQDHDVANKGGRTSIDIC